MARTREQRSKADVRLIGVVRLSRTALLLGTALTGSGMMVLSGAAMAQPAPNARPQGGVVAAGSAVISQTAGNTQITQSSQRAAVTWGSFNVGSRQSVTFAQPSSSAVTLNQVTGPNPSQIAGKISANGQLIIENQSGVVFYKGSQVDTAGLVVSAAGVTVPNFMAGKMVFNQAANPNAAVINQGHITIRDAGLAALVAPHVVNSGVITAKLGTVVLAGAKVATIDLYGDGLVSIDASGAVTQVPVGPDGKPVTALVTNTGVIAAQGGTVQLTAAAVDGLVTNLVTAGGHIAANSTATRTGSVVINGVGGSVTIEGTVAAAGNAANTRGGSVQVNATNGVTLAARSKINVSGRAGGGTAAIGTTLARATGGPSVTGQPTAQTVTVAKGATIAANATTKGNGGRVTVLSTASTAMAGTIRATGGAQGGNGGFVEVSGGSGFSLTGRIDVSAPHGTLGSILLDPTNLTIVSGASGSGDQDGNAASGTILAGGADTTNDTVSNGELESLTGNILLQAVNDLTVSAPITLTGAGQSLTLQAGNDLVVQAGAPINTQGNITLSAAEQTITGFNAAGQLTLNDSVSTTAGTVQLSAGTGGLSLNANVGGPVVALISAGTISQTAGSIGAGTLSLTTTGPGDVTLTSASNQIGGSTGLSVDAGSLFLVDNKNLMLTGTVSGADLFVEINAPGGTLQVGSNTTGASLVASTGAISLVADNITEGTAAGTIATPGFVQLAPFTAGRDVSLAGTVGNHLLIDSTLLGDITADSLFVGQYFDRLNGGATRVSAGNISIDGPVDPAGVSLVLGLFGNGAITEPTGTLTIPTLAGSGSSISLLATGNQITAIGGAGDNLTATAGNLSIVNGTSLGVFGTVSASGNVYLQTPGSRGVDFGPSSTVVAGGLASFRTDAFDQTGYGTVIASTFELAPSTLGGTVTLGGAGSTLASLADINAGTVRIGAVTEPNAGFTITAGSIDVGGSFGQGSTDLELDSLGGISEVRRWRADRRHADRPSGDDGELWRGQ